MEQSYRSLQDSKVHFQIGQLPGDETHTSRHTLTVLAIKDHEDVELSISLTVPQLVTIVKHFFWEATIKSAWAAKVLERLFIKRWAVYTSERQKEDKEYRNQCTQLDFQFVNGTRIMREKS